MSLYKLIILYLLRQVSFPLTTSQIAEFVVTQNYMTWFRMNEVLNNLVENELAEAIVDQHMTYYNVTQQGLDLLDYLDEDLSSEIKSDVRMYLKENAYAMRAEASTSARYQWDPGKGYVVHCLVREQDITMIDLILTVQDEESAQRICDNWYRKNADLYNHLMQELM